MSRGIRWRMRCFQVSAAAPVLVQGVNQGARSIAVGEDHMLAVTPAGDVWAWGNNQDGQLGHGEPFDALMPIPSRLD
ncbi:RCC1 domain-containing protein [Myxococcus eversor]|uniref:RCC1 domain-containing protein n=1 Tax=Myxococcus eversor TaxID=2709661 RepID=UPI0013CF4C16|nr:RCC1 domain-containing protein [Myxococcus eversor]